MSITAISFETSTGFVEHTARLLARLLYAAASGQHWPSHTVRLLSVYTAKMAPVSLSEVVTERIIASRGCKTCKKGKPEAKFSSGNLKCDSCRHIECVLSEKLKKLKEDRKTLRCRVRA